MNIISDRGETVHGARIFNQTDSWNYDCGDHSRRFDLMGISCPLPALQVQLLQKLLAKERHKSGHLPVHVPDGQQRVNLLLGALFSCKQVGPRTGAGNVI